MRHERRLKNGLSQYGTDLLRFSRAEMDNLLDDGIQRNGRSF